VTVISALGRLVAIAGAALTVGAVGAYVSGWVISAIRYAPDWNVGIIPLVFVLQIVVAGWVVWSVLGADPLRMLRNVLVAFALTFLLGYGWYFMLAGWGSDPMSIGNLLYLAAALHLAAAVMAASALGDTRSSNGAAGEAISRGVRAGSRMLGAILFVAVAAVVGYQTIPPVPPEDRAIASPVRPSCPEYLDEEVATFEGGGARTTPAFEVSGYWGLEHASTGYGTIAFTVLDEDGDAPYGTEGPLAAGDSVGGGEYASGGTFRLEIEADDDARYAVVVCDGAGPNRGGSASQAVVTVPPPPRPALGSDSAPLPRRGPRPRADGR
jgi:hypothetical protein